MTKILSLMLLWSVIGIPHIGMAKIKSGQDKLAPEVYLRLTRSQSSEVLTKVLEVTPTIPRGASDILADYEAEMGYISRHFSGELAAISQAFTKGQLTREQAEYLSRALYQVTMIQLELLDTWHGMLEQDLAQASAIDEEPQIRSAGQTLVLPLPFSSLQFDPSLAQYLELRPKQVVAIQNIMAEVGGELRPLMADLNTTKQRLAIATQNGHPNQQQVRSLALAQNHLLTKIIAANSQMQIRISRVLNPEQRRKLEKVKQQDELWELKGE